MIDLKKILDDRSTAPHDLMQHLRLSQVEHKIKVRRNRRITVGSVCAAVVIAIFGYAVMPRITAVPMPPAASPSPMVKMLDGFPEYDSGRKVVAAASAPIYRRTVSVTWTPTTWSTLIDVECRDLPDGTGAPIKLAVNGHPFHTESSTCNLGLLPGQETLSKMGVKIGEPSTITATVTSSNEIVIPGSGSTWVPFEVPLVGTIAMAIKVDVPFEEYPFPPRPAKLKPLVNTRICGEEMTSPAPEANMVRSDPTDPTRPMTMTLVWKGNYLAMGSSQTPGHLRVAVNGVEIEKITWWDYNPSISGSNWNTANKTWKVPGWTHPRQGEQVTVTLTPVGLTGAWQYRLAPTIDPDGMCMIE